MYGAGPSGAALQDDPFEEEDEEDADHQQADVENELQGTHAAAPHAGAAPMQQLTRAQLESKAAQAMKALDAALAALNKIAPEGAHVTWACVMFLRVKEKGQLVDKKLVKCAEHAGALFSKNVACNLFSHKIIKRLIAVEC